MPKPTLFADSVTLFDTLKAEAKKSCEYDAKSGIVHVDVGVGEGKGRGRLRLDSSSCVEVHEVLKGFDPSATRTPAEIVRSTLTYDPDSGLVSFKTSDEPNTRSVRVPIEDWSDLLRFTEQVAEGLPAMLEYYRQIADAQSGPTPQKTVADTE